MSRLQDRLPCLLEEGQEGLEGVEGAILVGRHELTKG